MIERPVMEQFYYILEAFQILWPYQQSIKYFAVYEEKINCEEETWLHSFAKVNMYQAVMWMRAKGEGLDLNLPTPIIYFYMFHWRHWMRET